MELNETALFINRVEAELRFARGKFPGNTIQMMALSEEVGELAKALIDHRSGKCTAADVYAEAVQVAAMAARVAVDGDSSVPYSPHEGAITYRGRG